jgi:dTDP-L-rhamnose 4-epimerase
VFNAGPLGDPAPCAAGLHRDVCHVPADLMNDGIYSIELLVVRDRQTVVYQHRGLLTFEVKDSADGRGSWHGEWQGIVRPQLRWQSHEIEHAVAGTGHPAREAQEAPGRVAIMDSSGRQSRRRVLVTGGAGFIGSHLVDALVSRGHQVRILDALVPQVHGTGARWPAWVPADVETMRGDVRDPATWEGALRDCEVVYHLAAEVGVGQSMYEITRYMDANTMGTAHMLELLARGRVRPRKLILASSMSVYGEGAYRTASGDAVYPALRAAHTLQQRQWNLFADHGDALVPQPTDEDKPLRPASIYAVSKRDQEEMCLTVGRAYGIPTVAFRCFKVYGPRQALSNPYTGIAAIFSGRILNGQPPVVFEDGRQGRDFINVTDIVQGLLLPLASDGADYQAVNLGTGRCTSVLEVAETLIRLLGADVTPLVNNHYRAGDIRCCYADISKAGRLLGFRPAVTFEAGMEELIVWLRRQTAVDRVDAATAELKARGPTR